MEIHYELRSMTGSDSIKDLVLSGKEWRVSDDTVMHIATAKALLDYKNTGRDVCHEIAKNYVECFKRDMRGRAEGVSTRRAINRLNDSGDGWKQTEFDPAGGGCGAAMRTMSIGLFCKYPKDIEDLIRVSIDSSRITHHHPTGYLGGFVTALFTALAIARVPIIQWPKKLFQHLNEVEDYIKKSGRFVSENLAEMDNFKNNWLNYLKLRSIDKINDDNTTDEFDVKKLNYPSDWLSSPHSRDQFYTKFSYRGWAGASGDDCTIVAYDALLFSSGDWDKFCLCGVLHGGDNDSTGCVGGAWFGAYYGFRGVPLPNYENMEYYNLLYELGHKFIEQYHHDV
eukprot:TRINITY_DN6446_c0_g1_i13.p1 TRINITY_DN6446_c0_g1~~TRINITY_DN6446_c0_g1_i13.p1  ORF type:complete len:339 (-),score=43.35 TRINITY_DN6446_c0_g1_i13:54-1070(-)